MPLRQSRSTSSLHFMPGARIPGGEVIGYPEVQRITDKLLETLEEFMRDRAKQPKSPPRRCEEPASAVQDQVLVQDMNSLKALPAPENFQEQKQQEEEKVVAQPRKAQNQPEVDLVDLRDDLVTADSQGNKLALALFSDGGTMKVANGTWETFPSAVASDEREVTSAWQTPATETGKADWELALVETASNLAKQKASMGGGFDHLLLNGMYDQGLVMRHASVQASGGSVSSVVLPGPGKSTPILALPSPDGTVHTIGQDPFAASLSIPPPSYVQMADTDRKQQLLFLEQQMWQQYSRDGMLGQTSLSKLNNVPSYANPAMAYGLPPSAGYYYPHM
ncbi:hypothetical protein HPP92_007908 [Vanilla planifolia]|uniref:Uncharacterized protein n=1 Tax=Vanilla planifolia TaxID=51239 RepID=A0A835REY1_VANPL|nr:hypothetical protein HPP92_007908 [Vanilla planifolia]